VTFGQPRLEKDIFSSNLFLRVVDLLDPIPNMFGTDTVSDGLEVVVLAGVYYAWRGKKKK